MNNASRGGQRASSGMSSSRRARRAEIEAGLGGLSIDIVAAAPTAHGLDEASEDYARAYFFELDRHCLPALSAHPSAASKQRSADVIACSATLLARLKLRHRAQRAALPRIPTSAELPLCDRGTLRRLEHFIAGTLKLWFPGPFHGISPPSILAAYEMFATGRLGNGRFDRMVNTWPGQPDGMNIFLLAEFALMSLDAGIAPPFWRHMAAIFTVAEQLFSVSYGRSAASRAAGTSSATMLTWQTRGPPLLPTAAAPLVHNTGWREWIRSTYMAPTTDSAQIHGQLLLRACPGGFGAG
ncbi:MAG: hypothetical protein ACI9EF_001806 [Pseudohongiellaceae bacterium]|jgi:hypothetical protein